MSYHSTVPTGDADVITDFDLLNDPAFVAKLDRIMLPGSNMEFYTMLDDGAAHYDRLAGSMTLCLVPEEKMANHEEDAERAWVIAGDDGRKIYIFAIDEDVKQALNERLREEHDDEIPKVLPEYWM